MRTAVLLKSPGAGDYIQVAGCSWFRWPGPRCSGLDRGDLAGPGPLGPLQQPITVACGDGHSPQADAGSRGPASAASNEERTNTLKAEETADSYITVEAQAVAHMTTNYAVELYQMQYHIKTAYCCGCTDAKHFCIMSRCSSTCR